MTRPQPVACFVSMFTMLIFTCSSFSQVKTESGLISGVQTAPGVTAYKGIPYAAAPTGPLRWKAPQPAAKWDGIKKASEFGNDCMQKPIASDAAPLGTEPGEDCLCLNVWAPSGSSGELFPVMVWIHGGGFTNGGSSASIYDGTEFAKQGIVVVSFNYRLGRFGFFAHPALTAERSGPLANYGYMDQLAALNWVQKNIAAFNGDKNKITIIGESAGGASVLDLLASHPDKGLYHRAVVMSGGGRTFLGGFDLRKPNGAEPSAEQIGVNFAKAEGIKDSGITALKKLRELPAEKVRGETNMTALLLTAMMSFGPVKYVRGPVIDGDIVKDHSEKIFQSKQMAKVPLLIGTTSADLGVWLPKNKIDFFSYFGPSSSNARKLYDPTGKLKDKEVTAVGSADFTMHEPARFVASQMTTAGSPVWLYRFSYVAESERSKEKGAGHASELPYLFKTLDKRYPGAVTPKDRATAEDMFRYVVNFIKNGDPNGNGLTRWSQFIPDQSNLLNFSMNDGSVMQTDPWKKRLDLMKEAAETRVRPITASGIARKK